MDNDEQGPKGDSAVRLLKRLFKMKTTTNKNNENARRWLIVGSRGHTGCRRRRRGGGGAAAAAAAAAAAGCSETSLFFSPLALVVMLYESREQATREAAIREHRIGDDCAPGGAPVAAVQALPQLPYANGYVWHQSDEAVAAAPGGWKQFLRHERNLVRIVQAGRVQDPSEGHDAG